MKTINFTTRAIEVVSWGVIYLTVAFLSDGAMRLLYGVPISFGAAGIAFLARHIRHKAQRRKAKNDKANY